VTHVTHSITIPFLLGLSLHLILRPLTPSHVHVDESLTPHRASLAMAATSRRVSYILPMPNDPPPLLSLPPIEQVRRGHTSPFFLPKSDPSFQSKNPFLNPSPPPSAKPPHPRHCLGISSLALDTSTLLSNTDSPGGILYSGGRDGLVASWELNVPHKKRRGRRYEDTGRSLPVKWERIGDGAEFFDDEDEESDEDDVSSSDEDMGEGWVGVGEGAKREVPYEDRWEVDHEELHKRQVSPYIIFIANPSLPRRSANPPKPTPIG
jgi:WD repeat-containing protein 48